MQRDLAMRNFIQLYEACGAAERFDEAAVRERQTVFLPDVAHFANDPSPVGALHPSDPTARGAIPRVCAVLANYLAGFDTFDVGNLEGFDVEAYIKNRMQVALADLRARGIQSSMTAEEVLAITRGE
jgi:hypothetical protein